MSAVLSVVVHNAQRSMRVDLASLQRFATSALRIALRTKSPRARRLGGLQQIDVILISNRRMAALHKRFMNLTGPTDVLTFQHGEIFVSTETARSNAARYGTTTEEEIRLYVVHGLLHLMGFDDTTPAAARAMEKMQQRIVASAGSVT